MQGERSPDIRKTLELPQQPPRMTRKASALFSGGGDLMLYDKSMNEAEFPMPVLS
jgi:hypothetical protein